MSDDEETLFESKKQLSVAAAARRLRKIADGLESGALRLGGHAVTPASRGEVRGGVLRRDHR